MNNLRTHYLRSHHFKSLYFKSLYLKSLNIKGRGLAGLILLGVSILLGGCSSEDFKRAGYGAVKIHQCNEEINDPACSDHYPTYEEYQREKSKIPE